MRKNDLVTIQHLRALHACKPQRDLFRQTFPNGVALTIENLVVARKTNLDLHWFAQQVLDEEAWWTFSQTSFAAHEVCWKVQRQALNTRSNIVNDAERTYIEARRQPWAIRQHAYEAVNRDYVEAIDAADDLPEDQQAAASQAAHESKIAGYEAADKAYFEAIEPAKQARDAAIRQASDAYEVAAQEAYDAYALAFAQALYNALPD